MIAFDVYTDKSRSENLKDISPRKVGCPDEVWNKYETLALDDKGATQLRQDPQLLDRLLNLLQSKIFVFKNRV